MAACNYGLRSEREVPEPVTSTVERPGSWSVTQRDFELRMCFDDGASRAQYAALHLDSSYLRFAPSHDSGWGTSIVLLPSLWNHGQLFQGAAVAVTWWEEESQLLLAARGRIGLLDVELDLRISPPDAGRLSARVSGRAAGKMRVDRREGEAFRLVTLSSMRVSERLWDARAAYLDDRSYRLGEAGWFVEPGPNTLASRFGLVGGSSEWKANAPTVGIALDRRYMVGGWLTRSRNPSGDNVSLWCASTSVTRAWSYTIHAWH